MLEITYRPLAELVPYERNPRTHDKGQIAAIERSLVRFGWATPVGIADGVLVYGHARRQAAINLRDRGIAIPGNDDPAECPTVDLSRLDPSERRAYVIADNQLSTLAGWDQDLLKLEMQDLDGAGFDLTLTGFTLGEIKDIMIEPVGDDVPGSLLGLLDVTIAEPAHGVEAGDHYVLSGRHHLLCVSVIEGWPDWRPFLKKGHLFVPYPGPFVPFGRKAQEAALVMVQPDAYAAGHLLDRYAQVRGEEAVCRYEPPAPKAVAA